MNVSLSASRHKTWSYLVILFFSSHLCLFANSPLFLSASKIFFFALSSLFLFWLSSCCMTVPTCLFECCFSLLCCCCCYFVLAHWVLCWCVYGLYVMGFCVCVWGGVMRCCSPQKMIYSEEKSRGGEHCQNVSHFFLVSQELWLIKI